MLKTRFELVLKDLQSFALPSELYQLYINIIKSSQEVKAAEFDFASIGSIPISLDTKTI